MTVKKKRKIQMLNLRASKGKAPDTQVARFVDYETGQKEMYRIDPLPLGYVLPRKGDHVMFQTAVSSVKKTKKNAGYVMATYMAYRVAGINHAVEQGIIEIFLRGPV